MKKIALTIVILSIVACSGQELEHKVIMSKSNESFFNEPLKEGWCRFFYKSHKHGEWIEFKEYCDKYQVGDTIHGLTHKQIK